MIKVSFGVTYGAGVYCCTDGDQIWPSRGEEKGGSTSVMKGLVYGLNGAFAVCVDVKVNGDGDRADGFMYGRHFGDKIVACRKAPGEVLGAKFVRF